MRLKCPKCGQTETFFANQAVRGTITVKVDNTGSFADNVTDSGDISSDGLDCDDPEGPFTCGFCSTTEEDVEAIDEDEREP